MTRRIIGLLKTVFLVTFLSCLTVFPCAASGDDSDAPETIKVKPVFEVHHMPKVPGMVFQAETVDSINIHLCGPDGTPRPLTDRHFAKRPSPSSDGSLLFFQDSEDNPLDAKEMTDADRQRMSRNPLYLFQVYGLDMNNGRRFRISDGTALDSIPVAAPSDLRKVAFCSRAPQEGDNWRIFIMNHDGSHREPMGGVSDGAQLFPNWAPDAKKLVYVLSRLNQNEATREPKPETYLMIHDLEKRTTRQLPIADMLVDNPSWSPKGDWIAFTVYDMKDDSYALWRIKSDGSSLQRVTSGPNHHTPAWLPDGEALLFSRGIENGLKEICMVNLNTGKITRLISAKNASCENPQVYPARRVPEWEPH